MESLVKGLGAEKAGMKVGDIVTQVDGTEVTSMTDLIAQIRKHAPNTLASVTVLRDVKTLTFKVEVSDRPASMGSSVPSTSTTSP